MLLDALSRRGQHRIAPRWTAHRPPRMADHMAAPHGRSHGRSPAALHGLPARPPRTAARMAVHRPPTGHPTWPPAPAACKTRPPIRRPARSSARPPIRRPARPSARPPRMAAPHGLPPVAPHGRSHGRPQAIPPSHTAARPPPARPPTGHPVHRPPAAPHGRPSTALHGRSLSLPSVQVSCAADGVLVLFPRWLTDEGTGQTLCLFHQNLPTKESPRKRHLVF